MKHKDTELTIEQICRREKKALSEYKRIYKSNHELFLKVLSGSVNVKSLRDHYKKQWLKK